MTLPTNSSPDTRALIIARLGVGTKSVGVGQSLALDQFNPMRPGFDTGRIEAPCDRRRHPKHHLAWVLIQSEIKASADGAMVSSMAGYSLTAPVFAV
jgi:hypothetical protein